MQLQTLTSHFFQQNNFLSLLHTVLFLCQYNPFVDIELFWQDFIIVAGHVLLLRVSLGVFYFQMQGMLNVLFSDCSILTQAA